MRNRVFIAVVVFFTSVLAEAGNVTKTFRADQKVTIAQGGIFVLENPIGNVEIIGGDGAEIEATALTTVTAVNAAALEEGHRRTVMIIGGSAAARVLRSNVPSNQSAEWQASVDWVLKVPRLTNVNVLSQASRRIRIMNINGDVRVKNFAGNVLVANVTGKTIVDSVNGSIAFSTQELGASAVLTSVNGTITASVPDNANVKWVAETAKGDIRTNLPARGVLVENTYRGTINGEGGSTVTTATLMGNIFLLANGRGMGGTRSLKPPITPAKSGVQSAPTEGFFQFYTQLGDVSVPEIRGSADVFTGAGHVQLPRVTGSLKVFSQGGPLSFGDIGGEIDASTWAGDISIDRARSGGTVTTRGGTIHILLVNGPMRLMSAGGDITVRRTTAPVTARTTSGDIAVVIDSRAVSESVDARTEKGNVIIHIPVNFSADVDATIITSDPDNDVFLSDLPGLSISKEQIGGGKTRVRATGKLNKGGERLLLEAINGDIRISTAPPSAATLSRRRH
jgi:DUF4097 and DUF4098 domain-containing protein YvlB